jgi:hypothetical protein
MVLAMLPPQIRNCWLGVTCAMYMKTVPAQAASSGAGSRRRSTRNAPQQVTGSSSSPSAVTNLKAIWAPSSGVSTAISVYGSGK